MVSSISCPLSKDGDSLKDKQAVDTDITQVSKWVASGIKPKSYLAKVNLLKAFAHIGMFWRVKTMFCLERKLAKTGKFCIRLCCHTVSAEQCLVNFMTNELPLI